MNKLLDYWPKMHSWKNRGIIHIHKIEYLNSVQGLETFTSRDFMRVRRSFPFWAIPVPQKIDFGKNAFGILCNINFLFR